jgi:hypothetical protein
MERPVGPLLGIAVVLTLFGVLMFAPAVSSPADTNGAQRYRRS